MNYKIRLKYGELASHGFFLIRKKWPAPQEIDKFSLSKDNKI
jgi:hypothetical protein